MKSLCNEHCFICYESLENSDLVDKVDIEANPGTDSRRLPALQLKGCGHGFCYECLLQYCEHCISIKNIPIPCPCYAAECPEILSDEVVRHIIVERQCVTNCGEPNTRGDLTQSVILWKRYLRFQKLARNPFLISCPRCEELHPPVGHSVADCDDEEWMGHTMTCKHCQHQFCQYHGDAHAVSDVASCRRFILDSEQVQRTEKVLHDCTKPCSHCGVALYKHAGCDHIICLACGNDMCWKCGSHLNMTGIVIRTCHACQKGYLDHRYEGIHRLRVVLLLPLILPFLVLYVVVLTTVALATGFFCCCCTCTLGSKTDTERSRYNISPTPRYNPMKAIQTGFYIIVLPFLFLLTDFGFHFDFVETVMENRPDENSNNDDNSGNRSGASTKLPEIPTMTLNSDSSGADETGKKNHLSINQNEPNLVTRMESFTTRTHERSPLHNV